MNGYEQALTVFVVGFTAGFGWYAADAFWSWVRRRNQCADGSPNHDMKGQSSCPACGATPKLAEAIQRIRTGARFTKYRFDTVRDVRLPPHAPGPAAVAPCNCCGKPNNPARTSMPRCDWCMGHCDILTGEHTPEPENAA